MRVTTAGHKGGVGKSTTAIHLAYFLHQRGPTLLIDGDPNQSVSTWAAQGQLPFPVLTLDQVDDVSGYEHLVFDTQARPLPADLQALAEGCDLLVLPTSPDFLSLDALIQTADDLGDLGATNYRILLTMIPPRPRRDGDDARATLLKAQLPVFEAMVPRLVAFEKAPILGVTVDKVRDDRAGAAWEAYRAVGEELGL
jgi:chromosome partitioning protein